MDPEQLARVFATAVAQALFRQQQQQQQQRPQEAIAALKVGLKDLSGRQEGWEDWRIEQVAPGEADMDIPNHDLQRDCSGSSQERRVT